MRRKNALDEGRFLKVELILSVCGQRRMAKV